MQERNCRTCELFEPLSAHPHRQNRQAGYFNRRGGATDTHQGTASP